ncbi:MAG: hypothetical protein Q7T63_09900, partial [Burkholderiaceae bacterium]|nr:hypothetical protein [Burkholderiaceae bacterium]
MVTVKSAWPTTGTGTVTVLLGVGSGVVLVPLAVFVTVPTAFVVTLATTTKVKVWFKARLLVVAPTEQPTTVAVPRLRELLTKLRPVPSTSVIVTF